MPVLRPMKKPLEKGAQRLLELHQQAAHTAFESVQTIFVKEVCPSSKKQWRTFQKQHKDFFPEYQPGVTDALNQACRQPTEFLNNVGYAILLFLALIFRWFLVRTSLAIGLLPFRIMSYPCAFLHRLIFGGGNKKTNDKRSPTKVIPGTNTTKKTD
jgi:hypothetical protein